MILDRVVRRSITEKEIFWEGSERGEKVDHGNSWREDVLGRKVLQ